MEVSYISEHTIEYIITAKLCELLKQRFSKTIPIYFWATREGNSLSAKIHNEQKLKVLAVFPRRPKLERKDFDFMYGKINASIIEFSEVSKSLGIPTIFYFPVIFSLVDIASNFPFFSMELLSYEQRDIHFSVNNKTSEIHFKSNDKMRINLLSDEDMMGIASNSKEISWNEALMKMNKLRHVNQRSKYGYGGFGFAWMSQYKPIYFLMFK